MEVTLERILSASNHYECLGVPTSATADVIKASFRKGVLAVHPDKNNAPRAPEAFRKVTEAKDCLLDPNTKFSYDSTVMVRFRRVPAAGASLVMIQRLKDVNTHVTGIT